MTKSTMALQKVSINSPQAMANFAAVLKQFIIERKLYSQIQGKNYVNVEGWEFAGASLGIYAIVKEVLDVSVDKEIKYSARVELINTTSGKIVGGSVAICSSKESGKSNYAEYAIASMAQTRAIGKAYRNTFAWLMKMAGYEPTPAEEAIYETTPTVPEVLLDDIEDVKKRVTIKLDALPTTERLRAIKVTGKLKVERLTDIDWRRLDMDLKTDTPEKDKND